MNDINWQYCYTWIMYSLYTNLIRSLFWYAAAVIVWNYSGRETNIKQLEMQFEYCIILHLKYF